MASGAVVGLIHTIMPPATLFPQLSARSGASSPAERYIIWLYDAATIEYMDYLVELRGYAGGGLTVNLFWSATSALTGVCRWEVAFRRIQDDAEDMDVSATYDYNTVDATVATVSGEVAYDSLTFTSGVDMDSWVEGEIAIMRVRRNAAHANDTMTGDAELWGNPTIRET